MKHISSRDNPQFKSLKKLANSAKERKTCGQCILDGAHLIGTYRQLIDRPQVLIVSEYALENLEINALVESVPSQDCLVLTNSLFKEIAPVDSPTGILALIDLPALERPLRPAFVLLVEAVQDPGNLGSILRSAAAAGVELACLSSGCADPWSPKSLRGGMGAHFMLPIWENCDLEDYARQFDGALVATSLQASDNLFDIDLSGRTAIIVGNEGAGISQRLLKLAKHQVRIPMPGGMESLNAAAAAAICLFERVRQTSTP